MTNYLICHKVRGEPAFDVAQRCDAVDGWGTPSDPAPWWIIPTSGHRAYPFYSILLKDLYHHSLNGNYYEIEDAATVGLMPEGLPDHYSINDLTVIRVKVASKTHPTSDDLLI